MVPNGSWIRCHRKPCPEVPTGLRLKRQEHSWPLTRDWVSRRLARAAFSPVPEDTHIKPLPPGTVVTHAAVLVPLVDREQGVNVLLTKRTSHLNHHPNQISFPGGRVEVDDRDRIETALRETEEEIGLARHLIEIAGTLPDYEMPSGFVVTPVVGWIVPPFECKADPFEVHTIFEVPLARFLCADNYQRRRSHFEGRDRDYLATPYQGHYIWGATAAMLYSLFRQLSSD